MFSSSQLKPDQQESLRALAAEGATLSDLQRHLKEEFGISATYMDMRFVVLDLGIELVEPKEEKPAPTETVATGDAMPAADAGGQAPGGDAAGGGGMSGAGEVSVSVDSITLPGTLVSGKVTFSDGETGVWMIDQSGRPGLDPDTPGYRPSQEDVMEFQTKLRAVLEGGGY